MFFVTFEILSAGKVISHDARSLDASFYGANLIVERSQHASITAMLSLTEL